MILIEKNHVIQAERDPDAMELWGLLEPCTPKNIYTFALPV
jgi:hypothetical protein